MSLISVRDILKCGTTVTMAAGHIHNKVMVATQEITISAQLPGPCRHCCNSLSFCSQEAEWFDQLRWCWVFVANRPAKGQWQLPHSLLLLHVASDVQYPCWSPDPCFSLLILSPDWDMLPSYPSLLLQPWSLSTTQQQRGMAGISRLQPALDEQHHPLSLLKTHSKWKEKRQSWSFQNQCKLAGKFLLPFPN